MVVKWTRRQVDRNMTSHDPLNHYLSSFDHDCSSAGFSHKDNPQTIDLNCVRLCFQVFREGNEKGAFTFALKPVVSDPIYDKSKFLVVSHRSYKIWAFFGFYFFPGFIVYNTIDKF